MLRRARAASMAADVAATLQQQSLRTPAPADSDGGSDDDVLGDEDEDDDDDDDEKGACRCTTSLAASLRRAQT